MLTTDNMAAAPQPSAPPAAADAWKERRAAAAARRLRAAIADWHAYRAAFDADAAIRAAAAPARGGAVAAGGRAAFEGEMPTASDADMALGVAESHSFAWKNAGHIQPWAPTIFPEAFRQGWGGAGEGAGGGAEGRIKAMEHAVAGDAAKEVGARVREMRETLTHQLAMQSAAARRLVRAQRRFEDARKAYLRKERRGGVGGAGDTRVESARRVAQGRGSRGRRGGAGRGGPGEAGVEAGGEDGGGAARRVAALSRKVAVAERQERRLQRLDSLATRLRAEAAGGGARDGDKAAARGRLVGKKALLRLQRLRASAARLRAKVEAAVPHGA